MSDSAPDSAGIIVIGGGPAGIMAAGRAGELGAKVTLIEKNPRLGVKLLITGGGRCNVTNSAGMKGFIEAFGKNGKFLYGALSVFSNQNLTGFLNSHGVPTRTDPDGKIFPSDDKAQSVLSALSGYLRHGKVRVVCGLGASGILIQNGSVEGVKLPDGTVIRGGKIIIATGGMSYPETGSTGEGYAWAKQCGHTIIPLRPGLTALESDEPFIKDLQGLTLQNITIAVLVNGRKAAAERGDLLFTHFGVSGPRLLVLSGTAVDALQEPGGKVELSLNLKPELAPDGLAAEIQKYFAGHGARMLSSYLKEALPGSLAPVFEGRCGIDRARQCASITGAERKKIVGLFSDFRVHITRPRPLREATVTRGGVNLAEINPRTMESRTVRGLYFCGEVLDLDGITGGYNLQEAFSTGYLAGQSAAAPSGAT
ncbi:MAG: NAD(P)/FAD-dependent oxidoreductase [Elusimicrobiota bacterium]|nr:NAD(P)/FAD-dependent oxidoreductase [Elusimicrobiota bacterium]